jgi:SAM-dependent methyltransferase
MRNAERGPGAKVMAEKTEWYFQEGHCLPKPMTAPGLHERLLPIVQRYIKLEMDILDLGSGEGALPLRLHLAGYRIEASDLERRELPFPYHQIDFNTSFASHFGDRKFAAIMATEVIEHLENPRAFLRQIRQLLLPEGIVVLTTPNASGVYSRLKFLFTGEMAMFSDKDYEGSGHISPITDWYISKILVETGFDVEHKSYCDEPFLPPRRLKDIVKIGCWLFGRPLMRGKVGGQSLILVLRKIYD